MTPGITGRWAIDHAETIKPANIGRIKQLGGGIAVQNRLAYSGEFFAERYGQQAAAAASPLRQLPGCGDPCRGGHGRDPSQQLQPVAVAVLDGHRQDRRRHPDRSP